MFKSNKKKKNCNVGTIPKSNIKIIERGKINTTNIQIHDHSLEMDQIAMLHFSISSETTIFLY